MIYPGFYLESIESYVLTTRGKMRKVGVIGLGHVGSTVAYTLVTKGIADELVLIDTNEAKCTAEYYDLLDSLGRLETYTKL